MQKLELHNKHQNVLSSLIIATWFICNLQWFCIYRKSTVLAYRRRKPSSTRAIHWTTTTFPRELSRTCWTRRSTKTSRIMLSSTSAVFHTTCSLDTACSKTSLRKGTWRLLRTFRTIFDRARKKSLVQRRISRATLRLTRCKSTTLAKTPRTCSRACYQRSRSNRAPIMSTPRSVTWTTTKLVLDPDH